MKLVAQGLVGIIWFSTSSMAQPTVMAALSVPKQPTRTTCPADIEALTNQLLQDLPSYANRVSQSSRRLNRIADIYSYVLIAGHPEFTPLPLGPHEYIPDSLPQLEPQQVFITTLERQYTAGKLIELQQYHWLFLTYSRDGWQLSLMFSRTGTYSALEPPTPPQDSSNGIIAQAVRTWLRDCQAGTLRNRHP